MKATLKTIETLVKLGFKDITEEDESTASFLKNYERDGRKYGFCIVEFYKENSELADEIGDINFHSAMKPFQDASPWASCFYEFQKDMEAVNGTIVGD